MQDKTDLFFESGLTIRPSGQVNRKAIVRIMRRQAIANRLPFTGGAIAIITRRAILRAKGAGIIDGNIVSKFIQKKLVGAGLSWQEASKVKWESIW